MLGDHLGSTSVLVNQNGTLNATNYYYPYGDNRGGSQSTLTAKRFTGQYHEAGIGLYYYNARWYDSRLGRFTQADTIVPNPASSMSLNRYMYVAGNPLRYTDPSGHCIPEGPGDRGSCVPSPPGGGGSGGSGGGNGGGGGGSGQMSITWSPNSFQGDTRSVMIYQSSLKFGIPYEFLASVIQAEQNTDYEKSDAFEDWSVRIALTLNQLEQSTSGLAMPGREGLVVARTIFGAGVISLAETLDSSLGIAQVRISVAADMERRYAPQGLHEISVSTGEIIQRLETESGNIEYAAAYTRYLTEIRAGQSGPFFEGLTIDDMQIIYGAYRAGIQGGYGSVSAYQSATSAGDWGRLLTQEMMQSHREEYY